MGFDITFHPVSEEEIQRYVFDVAADPSLADGRATELSKDEAHLRTIGRLYELFPTWPADPGLSVNHTYAFAAAILAGFLHPFWYSRNAGITLLADGKYPQMKSGFSRFTKLAGFPKEAMHGTCSPIFRGNESASGLMRFPQVQLYRKLVDQMATVPGEGSRTLLDTTLGEESGQALAKALEYCEAHKMGMIEATDVVVPIAGQSLTNAANMRAAFLNNL